jgi:hypothetical protein
LGFWIKLYPFSLLSVALQAHCEPTLEDGVVAPQNQFNVKSSWEKRTELKSLHTDVDIIIDAMIISTFTS